MDEFAQTRGADDLFDDDFTPIAKPETKTPNDQPQSPQRGGRSAHVPRGRGNRALPSPSQLRPTASELTSAATQSPEPDVDASSKVEEAEPSTLPAQQPATPQLPKPPAAVRGDRTATGGIVKPKLTEEELSAKLAAAKLNNAKRAEAHRLAEADEASFQQREAQAQQKRKEEGAARRAMNMEREKNRLRKLGQQAGREWDEGKEEQILARGRGIEEMLKGVLLTIAEVGGGEVGGMQFKRGSLEVIQRRGEAAMDIEVGGEEVIEVLEDVVAEEEDTIRANTFRTTMLTKRFPIQKQISQHYPRPRRSNSLPRGSP